VLLGLVGEVRVLVISYPTVVVRCAVSFIVPISACIDVHSTLNTLSYMH